MQNASRIAILKARESLVQVRFFSTHTLEFHLFMPSLTAVFFWFQQLKEQVSAKLAVISNEPEKYTQLLTNLIAQALFRLIEKEVYIKCREKDVHLVDVCWAKNSPKYVYIV